MRSPVAVAWQVVRTGDDAPAYYEALALTEGQDLGLCSAPEGVAMETAGLGLPADRLVIERVLAELRDDAGVVLGVNISGSSFEDGAVWAEVTARLRQRPDIAGRLIVELADTARFHDGAASGRLLAQWREAGCRLAFDDFGAADGDCARIAALAPEIVKIAAVYTRTMLQPGQGRERFARIAARARASGAQVVAQGVDDPQQCAGIHAHGIALLQGHATGSPSFTRPWRAVVASPP